MHPINHMSCIIQELVVSSVRG